ncbi:MAG: hypothetical protein ACXWC4_09995 [Telluria sp.]
MKRVFLVGLAPALLAAGCASGPPFVDQMQPKAVAEAQRRGQFELNCPEATGKVISQQQLQPLAFGGYVRAQYTVGVSGCGKRMVVEVLCSENNNQCIQRG